jgi:hypothetical protein
MEQKSTQDIVKAYCERQQIDFEKFYVGMSKAIRENKIRVMQHGNTLLTYRITAPHQADAHLITTESQPQIVEALREFYKAMKVAGFNSVTAELKTPVIASLLGYAGIRFSQSGNHIVIGG